MTGEIALVLGLALAMVVVLVREWAPADAVAILVVIALVVTRVLDPQRAVASLGDGAIVTVGSMFVLAAGLTKTGAVEFVGHRLLQMGGSSEPRLLAAMMLSVAFLSAFVNNTPLAVVFLPITLGLAEKTGIPAGKLLIPMSYATIVGGMCTLVGTSTNVLVAGRLPSYGLPAIGMFEPLPLAVAGIAMTIGYVVLVGRHLLPARVTVSSTLRAGGIRDYVTEIEIPKGSPFAGKPLQEAILAKVPGLRVLQVIRGEEILGPRHGSPALAEGDLLIVKGDVNALLALERDAGVSVAPALRDEDLRVRSRDATLSELVIRPGSAAIGLRVKDLRLHAQFGAVVLAVQRHATHIREKVADLHLRFGDVLLVQASTEDVARLRESPYFLVVEGAEERVRFSNRAGLALATMAAVMGLAAAGVSALPVWALALTGAVVMVAGGCVGVRDAYRAIDVRLLLLMWGTIALGQALDDSGAATFLAQHVVSAVGPWGDLAILSAVYLMTNALTALVSNAAAALVMLPIALSTAAGAHLNARPFVMAILFAASIDFSTPIGYQTNTFVYGPGGYRFSDFVKVGVPLNLLWWVLATVAIPLLWPLR